MKILVLVLVVFSSAFASAEDKNYCSRGFVKKSALGTLFVDFSKNSSPKTVSSSSELAQVLSMKTYKERQREFKILEDSHFSTSAEKDIQIAQEIIQSAVELQKIFETPDMRKDFSQNDVWSVNAAYLSLVGVGNNIMRSAEGISFELKVELHDALGRMELAEQKNKVFIGFFERGLSLTPPPGKEILRVLSYPEREGLLEIQRMVSKMFYSLKTLVKLYEIPDQVKLETLRSKIGFIVNSYSKIIFLLEDYREKFPAKKYDTSKIDYTFDKAYDFFESQLFLEFIKKSKDSRDIWLLEYHEILFNQKLALERWVLAKDKKHIQLVIEKDKPKK